MSTCVDCGMESPDASYFCGYCGHKQSSTATLPTRISRSLATELHPSDVTMLLSESSPIPPRRKGEEDEQHRPMAPPILLFAGQASSGSVPMIAGIPQLEDLPWVQNLLRAALSGVTAAKLALAPWIIITLMSVAMLIGAGMVLPHLLGPAVSTQVNVSGNPRQQAIPMSLLPGQTDCLPAGQVHVHDAQIRFCTSRPSNVSGNPPSPQQQGVFLSNRSSNLTSTVILLNVATGKQQTIVSPQIQRLLSLNTAVVSSTSNPLQSRSMLNQSVSTMHQVVRSVVGTTAHLPQVGNTLKSTLSKSVSTVHQVVNSVVNTTQRLPQVGNTLKSTLSKSVSAVHQVVRSVVNTTSHLPRTGNVLSKSVSTVHQIVQNTVSTVSQQPKTVQNTVSTATTPQQPQVVQPKVVQSTVSTATTPQQPKVVQPKVVQSTVSTTTASQQPKAVQSTVNTTSQQPKVGNALTKSTSTVHA